MGVKTYIIEKFSCNCWSGCNSKKNNAAFLDISKIRMHYFNHNFIIKKYGRHLNCDTLLLPDFDIFSMRFVQNISREIYWKKKTRLTKNNSKNKYFHETNKKGGGKFKD